MRLNDNFAEHIVINTTRMPWEDSPMTGVQRRKLDRIGDEVARATSLVKYEPGSHFPDMLTAAVKSFWSLKAYFLMSMATIQPEHMSEISSVQITNLTVTIVVSYSLNFISSVRMTSDSFPSTQIQQNSARPK